MLLEAACTHLSAASGDFTRLSRINAATGVNNAASASMLFLHGGTEMMGCTKHMLPMDNDGACTGW